ncbi:MAG: RHS repeat domain-containing protein, partial [Pyrinomonadaceae bacterium]
DSSGSWTYSWDYENRLKQASRSSGVIVTYAYDALGRRIQRTSSTGGTTRFVYDGADVVLDLDGSGVTIADYLNGPGIDNKLRQTISGAASYFLADHLGTTRSLTDASGNVTSSLGYDSFGNVMSGLAPTRYTYTGREMDSDLGLMYYRARMYNSHLGNFISEDLIGLEGGINLYSYVENAPVDGTDPFGLKKKKQRDRWYGYDDKNFHKWFHRCWKQAGDPDASQADIKEAYDEWLSRGSPQGGECWGAKKPAPSECSQPAILPKPSTVPRPIVPVPTLSLPRFFTIPIIMMNPCLVYPELCFDNSTD